MPDNDDDDVAVLKNEIRHLREVIRELKLVVNSFGEKLEHLDRRHNDSCRACPAWPRLSQLEIGYAEIRATARGWALGAAAIAGALSFLAAWFFRS